jgi:hypothetical protein
MDQESVPVAPPSGPDTTAWGLLSPDGKEGEKKSYGDALHRPLWRPCAWGAVKLSRGAL